MLKNVMASTQKWDEFSPFMGRLFSPISEITRLLLAEYSLGTLWVLGIWPGSEEKQSRHQVVIKYEMSMNTGRNMLI